MSFSFTLNSASLNRDSLPVPLIRSTLFNVSSSSSICPEENLFEYERLRREASRLAIVSIDREGERLAIKFSEQAKIDPEKLIAMVSTGDATFTPNGVMKVKLKADEDAEVFALVRDLLNRLR